MFVHAVSFLRPFFRGVAITLFFYAMGLGLTRLMFGEGPESSALPADGFLHLLMILCLWPIFRYKSAFFLFLGYLVAFLHIGHAAKTAILGGPMTPDDVYVLRDFLMIIEPWQLCLVLSLTIAGIGAVLFGLDWRRPRRLAAALPFAVLTALLVLAPSSLHLWMDHRFGHVEWDPAGNYRRRGPAVHTLQETARFLASQRHPPSAQDVADILPARIMPASHSMPISWRNLHVVVMESFWDAAQLTSALDRDPFPADFRALWAETGFSRILSPVFGGYTANAEFEFLCGFPVDEPAVWFERRVTRRVPALPAVLASQGYHAVASHPNIPVFWNRRNVYERLGFDIFHSGGDFASDDMNGDYLSDRSLYRQVMDYIGSSLDSGKPVFNYIVTIFGHFPYPLSENRPEVVESRSSVSEVGPHASTMYYKARELMDFLDELRARDPDGLVVIFGDHLPVLGDRFGAYAESGILAPEWAGFTPEMYMTLVSTPLLVIDGRNGPLPLGRMPLYRLPALILSLLGYNGPTIFDYTAPPDGVQIRPLVGLRLNLTDDGLEVCRNTSRSLSCQRTAEWLSRISVLADDLFGGNQYALPPTLPDIPTEISPDIPSAAETDIPPKSDSDRTA